MARTMTGTWIDQKRAGHRFATLTAYNYVMARLLDDCGLDFLLVGDSLGMVELGHPDTTHVTIDDMLHHGKAVMAGARKTPVVVDMPIGSCDTPDSALVNARELAAIGAVAVKIEGGREVLPQVQAIRAGGIAVISHLGMLPQRVLEEGGYKIKGRTKDQSDALLADALALEAAGVAAIVLELVTPDVAKSLTRTLKIPVIGIGSGDDCDGQILVTYDLLGMFPWFRPKFVKPEAGLADVIHSAVSTYCDRIRNPTH